MRRGFGLENDKSATPIEAEDDGSRLTENLSENEDNSGKEAVFVEFRTIDGEKLPIAKGAVETYKRTLE